MIERLRAILGRIRSRRDPEHAESAEERRRDGYEPRLYSMKGDVSPADLQYAPKSDPKRDRF